MLYSRPGPNSPVRVLAVNSSRRSRLRDLSTSPPPPPSTSHPHSHLSSSPAASSANTLELSPHHHSSQQPPHHRHRQHHHSSTSSSSSPAPPGHAASPSPSLSPTPPPTGPQPQALVVEQPNTATTSFIAATTGSSTHDSSGNLGSSHGQGEAKKPPSDIDTGLAKSSPTEERRKSQEKTIFGIIIPGSQNGIRSPERNGLSRAEVAESVEMRRKSLSNHTSASSTPKNSPKVKKRKNKLGGHFRSSKFLCVFFVGGGEYFACVF